MEEILQLGKELKKIILELIFDKKTNLTKVSGY